MKRNENEKMKKIFLEMIILSLIFSAGTIFSSELTNSDLEKIFIGVTGTANTLTGSSNKLLLVGFDGFTWRQIQPLISAGQMPNFKKLMEDGCALDLASTDFPSSAASWPSIMTGCKSTQTGINSFFKIDSTTYDLTLNHSRFRKVKALWELVSDAGKTCFSINVPMSWPPDDVNGVMITGLLSPKNKSFTFPESISEPLRKAGYVTGYRQFRQSLKFGGPAFADTGMAIDVNALLDIALTRYQVAQFLVKQTKWDLGIVVFTLVDRFQHNQESLGTSMIQHACKQMDMLLGGLVTSIPENTMVVLCSDHGFREYKETFLQAEWFRRNGYIHTDGQGQPIWCKTRLIPLDRVGNCGLYRWNVSGREKEGVISANQRENLFAALKEQLASLYDQNGNQIVESVSAFPEENGGADFIIRLRSDLLLNNSMDVSGDLYKILQRSVYDHENEGVGLLYAPGIITGNNRLSASVLDLTPTILQLLDLPIPMNMDGSVLKGAFLESWLQLHQVRQMGSSRRVVQKSDLRLQDDDIMTQLKSLGYIN
ncbi:alkaline phosphatase family protein [bacterium]|nr:alkaline phosphatase family protein [bacterium]